MPKSTDLHYHYFKAGLQPDVNSPEKCWYVTKQWGYPLQKSQRDPCRAVTRALTHMHHRKHPAMGQEKTSTLHLPGLPASVTCSACCPRETGARVASCIPDCHPQITRGFIFHLTGLWPQSFVHTPALSSGPLTPPPNCMGPTLHGGA